MRRPAAAVLALLAIAAAPSPQPPARPWWQGAFLYEVYPRSFADSDGDGVGDLAGITAHLDHLRTLGVDAIWITPTYPSPQVDFGYDISDYRAIDPRFGTMADFDALRVAADRRGIRLIVDMVLNHSSDQHPWFKASAASRTGPYANWYVWSDGLPAGTPGLSPVQRANAHDGRVPPNNWTSFFGGSSWEWVPARRQFYYHKFYRQQPDLNWREPAVERAMTDVLRFWLDRGVAGFRLDAVPHMFEDAQLRDEPPAGGTDAFGLPELRHVHTDDQPEIHAVLKRMRRVVDAYPGDRVLIGETYLPDTAALARWYGGRAGDELHLPMDLLPGFGAGASYRPAWFRPLLAAAQRDLDGHVPLFAFDNHDKPRSIDRFGDGVHDVAIAKGVAAMLLASRATALTYYGAEIGMRTRTPTRREEVRDPVGLAGWPRDKGRDGERTPMQWTAGPQAGFSSNPHPWLPIDPDYRAVNVAAEESDPASLLAWHRRLAELRRTVPALRDGTTAMLGDDPHVLAWTRTAPDGSRVVVAINMDGERRPIALPAAAGATLAASGTATFQGGSLMLDPFVTWIGSIGSAAPLP